MSEFVCDFCGKTFQKIRSQRAHRLRCKSNTARKIERKPRSDKGKSKSIGEKVPCNLCEKIYSEHGLKSHMWKAHGPGRDHNPNAGYKSGRQAWNKGLTKETSESLAKAAKRLKERWANKEITCHFTPEGRKRLSESAKRRGIGGGHYPHPNKGERYNGVWFDSKWEVRLAKSLDENLVRWERPSRGFTWTDEGRKYYPDFYLPDYNVFLEPKNDYLQKKDKLKIEEAQRRHSIRVIILNESQLSWNVVKSLIDN